MIPLYGTRKRLCNGLSRRDLLHIGGLSAFGLSLDMFGRLEALRAMPAESAGLRFGQAKACILLFLFGSPSQHETFDPKPDAPEQVRGEMNPIATAGSIFPRRHVTLIWVRDALMRAAPCCRSSTTHAAGSSSVARSISTRNNNRPRTDY